jgi:hypothetical protein
LLQKNRIPVHHLKDFDIVSRFKREAAYLVLFPEDKKSSFRDLVAKKNGFEKHQQQFQTD